MEIEIKMKPTRGGFCVEKKGFWNELKSGWKDLFGSDDEVGLIAQLDYLEV
jgi:hypothetical protein